MPREGRPRRTLEDLEKTEMKMRQYFERMYQKVRALPLRAERLITRACRRQRQRPPARQQADATCK